MYKVIVFAGTTEGREIAEFLDRKGISAHICVATEYGEQLLQGGQNLEISHERLNAEEMELRIKEKKCEMVIDATHPYAAEVTINIKKACEAAEVSYIRVLRENQENQNSGDCLYADSVEDAVALLEHTKGNILATTGSKEAAKYTALTDYESRVFLRVLSLPDVVKQCKELGFQGKNLICMQGPFSKELNIAMLRQWDCKYLVTKMSGATGGFQEKIDAARICGCISVIIGRPLKESGLSVNECKRILCQKFSLKSQAEISLVGIGMGSAETRTAEASRAIRESDLLIGARRMIDSCREFGKDCYVEYDSQKIAQYLAEHPEYEKVAVLLSGDPGFNSGAKKLLDVLGNQVKVISGISSASYFMSRIQKSWDDVLITSAHGKHTNLVSLIKRNKKVFSILGTRDGIQNLAQEMAALGLNRAQLYTGECLSYPDEKIRKGAPEDFLNYEADPLSVVYVENPDAQKEYVTHGIPDTEFLREKVPMTKEEVRTVSLSKLHLEEDSVCYDVGAGTGSVSIEMASRAWNGKVYAIEKKALAVELLKKNREKFAVENLEIIEGTAPEALENLEPPTHAFIGGSSGKMETILRLLLEKNPSVRIVINCIALETVSETLQCLKTLPVKEEEILQISVSKGKSIGNYHMMMGENPIYIISCTGGAGG